MTQGVANPAPAWGPYIFDKCRKFSPALSQAAIWTLDAMFLAGKVNKHVSPIIARLSLTALSAAGYLQLPYQIDLIGKTIDDALCGYDSQNSLALIISACKTVEIALNLGLMNGSMIAALAGLFGFTTYQTNYYEAVIPYAIGTLVFGAVLTFVYLAIAKYALSKASEEIIDKLETCEGSADAAFVRMGLDKDTLRVVIRSKDSIPPEKKSELIENVSANVRTQIQVTQGGKLLLLAVGYLAMGAEKYYTPNSLEAALINMGTASLYAIKLLIEFGSEAYQRQGICRLTNSESQINSDYANLRNNLPDEGMA